MLFWNCLHGANFAQSQTQEHQQFTNENVLCVPIFVILEIEGTVSFLRSWLTEF